MPLWEMCEVPGPANGPGTRSLFPRRSRFAEIGSRAARPLAKLVDVRNGFELATLNSSVPADEKGMLGYRAQVVHTRLGVGHPSISCARTRVRPLLSAMSLPGAAQPRGDRARPENGVAPVAGPDRPIGSGRQTVAYAHRTMSQHARAHAADGGRLRPSEIARMVPPQANPLLDALVVRGGAPTRRRMIASSLPMSCQGRSRACSAR